MDKGVFDSAIINSLGLLQLVGDWNANTNTPALASGVGNIGDAYDVNVAGNTNLDGITDWKIKDIAYFSAGGTWKKIDNTNLVTSVFSRPGDVVAAINDYTWAQINKATSDIADITTKSHTSLTDKGSNTHAQIDNYITNSTTAIGLNTTHRGSDGSDHSFLNQSVISGATPAFIGSSISNVDAVTLDGLDSTAFAILAGQSGGQTLIGGTGTTDSLILQTTSGIGAAGADMILKGGNNGTTEFARFFNNGNFSIGTSTSGKKMQIQSSINNDGLDLLDTGGNMRVQLRIDTSAGGFLNLDDASGNSKAKIRGYSVALFLNISRINFT